jgi:hypothetical protein
MIEKESINPQLLGFFQNIGHDQDGETAPRVKLAGK